MGDCVYCGGVVVFELDDGFVCGVGKLFDGVGEFVFGVCG